MDEEWTITLIIVGIIIVAALSLSIAFAAVKIDYTVEGLPETITIEQIENLKEKNKVFLSNKLPELNVNGYDFLGYYLGDEKVNKIKPFTFKLALTIKFRKAVYDIEYIHTGIPNNLVSNIENDNNPKKYSIDDSITFSKLKLRGAIFLGYVCDEINIDYMHGEFGDKTIICKWELIEYKIRYKQESSSKKLYSSSIKNPEEMPQKYTVDDYVLLPNLISDGYRFLGFYLNGKKISEILQGNIGDKNLICFWEPIEYKLCCYHLGVPSKLISNIKIDEKYLKYNIEESLDLVDMKLQGYEFLGYFYNEQKIYRIPKGNFGDKTIICRWRKI